MKRILLIALASALAVTPALAQPCDTLTFEDLILGTTQVSGDVFMAYGVTVSVLDFYYSIGPCGGATTSGFVEVTAAGDACGSVNELWVNNVRLDFDFGGPVTDVLIPYGEYGGTVSLTVNGTCEVATNFADLPASWPGGVSMSVVDFGTPGQGCGEITLVGTVTQLEIGGQELALDNLYYCVEAVSVAEGSWGTVKALY